MSPWINAVVEEVEAAIKKSEQRIKEQRITMDKKYQTRDGRAVEILRTNVKNGAFPIVGIIAERDGSEIQDRWTAGGGYYGPMAAGGPNCLDLIPVPTKHHGYIIISKDELAAIFSMTVYRMHQQAEGVRLNAAYPEAWIVVPLDWED